MPAPNSMTDCQAPELVARSNFKITAKGVSLRSWSCGRLPLEKEKTAPVGNPDKLPQKQHPLMHRQTLIEFLVTRRLQLSGKIESH